MGSVVSHDVSHTTFINSTIARFVSSLISLFGEKDDKQFRAISFKSLLGRRNKTMDEQDPPTLAVVEDIEDDDVQDMMPHWMRPFSTRNQEAIYWMAQEYGIDLDAVVNMAVSDAFDQKRSTVFVDDGE